MATSGCALVNGLRTLYDTSMLAQVNAAGINPNQYPVLIGETVGKNCNPCSSYNSCTLRADAGKLAQELGLPSSGGPNALGFGIAINGVLGKSNIRKIDLGLE